MAGICPPPQSGFQPRISPASAPFQSPQAGLGAALGVAVLGSVFSATGGLGSPGQFSTGLTAALTVSAAILAASALVILLAPETRPARQARQAAPTGAASAGLAVPGQRRGVTDLPA